MNLAARPRRRRWLLALAGALVLLAATASLARGLRYPPLQLDPGPAPFIARSPDGWRAEGEGAYARSEEVDGPTLRAFTPAPRIRLSALRKGSGQLVIENVHPEARVSYAEPGGEPPGGAWIARHDSTRLTLSFELEVGQVVNVRVDFPERETYRFAAIGDSGGQGELGWCLRRAVELGADFFLHLGDLAYLEGDFEGAAEQFRRSPIPVYAAVGNHDFHGGHRYRFRYFREHVGPLNSWFELGGVAFLNLDTAADLIPAGRGQRRHALHAFAGRAPELPLVAFTHRPLADPRVLNGERPPSRSHALNRAGEAEWLRAELLELGADVLLAGHVHSSFEFLDGGLLTFIAGDGLAQRGGRKPRILIGEFAAGEAPRWRWEPLDLPAEAKSREAQPDDERDP